MLKNPERSSRDFLVLLLLFFILCMLLSYWIELHEFKFLVGMLLFILSCVVCMALSDTL